MNTNCESGRRQALVALIPFAIALPFLVAAAILWFWSPLQNEVNSVAFGIAGAVLAFALPVCLLVLVQWLATGEPPKLSLSPLVPTREERVFRKRLRDRPKLNGDEFYDRFYAETSVPKLLAVKMRELIEYQLGLATNSLLPHDNLIIADPELDWCHLIEEINDEFKLVVPAETISTMDGTLDNLLRCVVESELPVTASTNKGG